jgi:hypothetical protein
MTTGQEQDFDYGIRNTAAEQVTDAVHIVGQNIDGTHEKIPTANIEKTSNKISSIETYSETLYPNEKAVHDLADTKLNISDLPSNLTFYPTTATADVSGYFKLVDNVTDADYNEPDVDVSTGAISTTSQLVRKFVSDTGLLSGNPGIVNISAVFNIKRVSGTGTADFFIKAYHRDSLGVETLVGTSNNTEAVSNSTYEQFSATLMWNNGEFSPTDRVVYELYSNRITGGGNPTYDIQFGGDTPFRIIFPVPFFVVAGEYELKANKQNSLAIDGTGTKYPTVDGVNSGLAFKQDLLPNPTTGERSSSTNRTYPYNRGTVLFHELKWFTPSSTVNTSGTTVTSVGTQFTSAMVGALIIINDEERIITAFTSSTVVTVGVAFSTNYSGVVAGSWGVYSKGYEQLSGVQRFFNTIGAVQFSIEQGQISFLQLQTGGNGTLITYDNVNVINTGMLRWSSTSQANGTKDVGLRRNASGVLEIFDGINANGLEANRRDLYLRTLIATSIVKSGGTSSQILLGDGTVLDATTKQNTISGTSNYLKKQVSTGVLADSQIFDNGTNIGIGTTSPQQVFHIKKGVSPLIRIESTVGPYFDIGFVGAFDFVIQYGTTKILRATSGGNQLYLCETTGRTIIGTSTDNGVDKLQVNGSITATSIKSTGVVRLKDYTVATLPAGTQGDTAYVTDAVTPTYLGALTGGGSVVCPVFYNGTIWVSH